MAELASSNPAPVPAGAPGKKTRSWRVKLDELAFCGGLVNVMLSSWLIGNAPYAFWVYHTIKMLMYLAFKVQFAFNRKQQFYMLEYCFTINYFVIIYYFICLAKPANFLSISPVIFRLLYTCCHGPLAMSIALMRNSMVLHDINQLSIVAIHLSPALAMYGMRWYHRSLEEIFPNVFNICGADNGIDEINGWSTACAASFVELWVYPVIAYIGLYFIPYYIFFFVLAREFIEKNDYVTVYNDTMRSPLASSVLGACGKWNLPLQYLLCHMTACFIMFLIGVLCWHSFVINTFYLMALILVAVYNGSTYYFEVFSKKYHHESAAGKPVAIETVLP